MKKTYSLVIVGFAGLAAATSKVSAAELSVGVYPPITRIKAGTSTHVVSPVSILNNTDSVLILDVSFLPFRASDRLDGSIEYYNANEMPQDISDFLKTITVLDGDKEVKTITAFPRQYKNISISFNTPLKEKDYYFSVIVTPQISREKTDKTRININPSVSSNVLLSINKKEQNGLINQFNTKSVILNGPANFNLIVQNSSDNYESASGIITVYDFFGNKSGTIKLEPAVILANSSRTLMAHQQGSSPAPLSWGEKFLLGRYTAQATVYLDGTKKITSETQFFAIPVVIILILVAFLFVVFSIALRVVKKINLQE